jgi:predicted dehydrogenase
MALRPHQQELGMGAAAQPSHRRLSSVARHLANSGGGSGGGAAPPPLRRRKARIALVGAGWWAQGWHLPQLHANPHCELVAVVEISPELRAELEEQYGCQTFGTFDALLQASLALDGVLISSPHKTHFELGKQAIAAGLHVLMEKPMTTSTAEAAELRSAAERGGRVFMVRVTRAPVT